MDFLRLVAAALFGGVVYYTALSSLPAALGVTAFLVMLAAGWNEVRLDRLAKAQDANFIMLRHLQRMPNGDPFNQD